ncbi:hypothetical protein ACLB1R_34780 [Escherichia coli]
MMDIRQFVAWVGTFDDVKNLSLLDTFKIAFASALPLHVVNLVLQAMNLSLGEDKDKSLEYFTAKKSS